MLYKQIYAPTHPNASASGCITEHVLIAERALGHILPKGAVVHHVDHNERNNTPRNLVICQDTAYHMLLHTRERVVKAGGNPNTDKYCAGCASVLPFGDFCKSRRNQGNGLQSCCRECQHLKRQLSPAA